VLLLHTSSSAGGVLLGHVTCLQAPLSRRAQQAIEMRRLRLMLLALRPPRHVAGPLADAAPRPGRPHPAGPERLQLQKKQMVKNSLCPAAVAGAGGAQQLQRLAGVRASTMLASYLLRAVCHHHPSRLHAALLLT